MGGQPATPISSELTLLVFNDPAGRSPPGLDNPNEPLPRPRFQLDVPSVDDEFAVSVVVKGLAILLRWIDPSLQYCKNENIVFVHKTRVGYFAFEIGKAFSDERGLYRCGGYFGQSEGREFIGVAAG